MSAGAIHIDVQPLRVKLKSTFRHAGAARNRGDSVWVRARRGGNSGFGEGCPRPYSAGDDMAASIAWVQAAFSGGRISFSTFDDMTGWLAAHADLVDRYPSAWCAVEMALLDLFSKERGCSVEELLGMQTRRRQGRYSAVLGDDNRRKYISIVDLCLVRGFSDFKIKLNGDLQRDREKVDLLREMCAQHGIDDPRIRLDANNLWADRAGEAEAHLAALGGDLFAVEEPVGSGDTAGISQVGAGSGLPVILDESLCTLEDLERFKDLPGRFIANIKVSRVGGILRSLEMVAALKKLGWPIIVGCHVGETSLLTRAALIPAAAAGEHLIAQEGAYGDYLVEREPVEPMLKFGPCGRLDLDAPYFVKTVHGFQVVPVENWHTGFGMTCRWPAAPDDGDPEKRVLEMPDRYRIHYRRWGPEAGRDVLMILHDGMGHSGWQAPLAKALRAIAGDLAIVAPDRRGCGLNAGRGDLGSVAAVVEDVVKQVEFLKQSFTRVHLAGWSQGSQYAVVAADRAADLLSSLILLAPGFFWNGRFRSVSRIAKNSILGMLKTLKLIPERDQAYVPIPMEAADFTLQAAWVDFIEHDDLKTTRVTLKSDYIVDEIQELAWSAILENKLPLLAILAEHDRLVDNRTFRKFLGHKFTGDNGNRLISLDSGHALQFEMPAETAGEIYRFIRGR